MNRTKRVKRYWGLNCGRGRGRHGNGYTDLYDHACYLHDRCLENEAIPKEICHAAVAVHMGLITRHYWNHNKGKGRHKAITAITHIVPGVLRDLAMKN